MNTLFAAARGLLGGIQSAGKERTFWMPEQAADVAPAVDFTFYFVYWVSVFFFVLIVAVTVFFLVKYRARPGHTVQDAPTHSTALELTWSIIPGILAFMMFFFGFTGYMEMNTPNANSYEILVTGQKWAWNFTYPNGYIDNNLHLPKGRNIRLVTTSQDVIHSLWIPAFRVKKDAVPGRYNKVWFQPTKTGTFPLYCTEYCGTSHSNMGTLSDERVAAGEPDYRVIVHEPDEFEAWLEEASDFLSRMPPDEAGALLYRKSGCAQCHSLDGTALIGPSFQGLYGAERQFIDGTTGVADENYIRESIIYPAAKKVVGYDELMPSYKGRLKDEEITALIAYFKTLN